MSESLVDRIYSWKNPVYSNACHHADLADTLQTSFEKTTSMFAAELVRDLYLSECQDRMDKAESNRRQLKETGTNLLSLTKQRALRRLLDAA